MIVVDLNADLGEGCASDAELLTLVSSANIACGFHAGDCLLYTSPSPRDRTRSRMPSSA